MSGANGNVLKCLPETIRRRAATASVIAIAILSMMSAIVFSYPARAQTECVLTSMPSPEREHRQHRNPRCRHHAVVNLRHCLFFSDPTIFPQLRCSACSRGHGCSLGA